MEEFTGRYRVAGIDFIMTTRFALTRKRAAKYLVAENETDSDKTLDKFAMPEGVAEEQAGKYPGTLPDDVEYSLTGRQFCRVLLKYNGIMLHSSAVVVDGYAYMFSADSGTGKSTHTALWLKHFKENAYVINDDKPALRKTDGEWYAYGTPWSGKFDANVNTRAKLGAIVFLERSENNWVKPMSPAEAIPLFVAQTARRFTTKEETAKMLNVLDEILTENPIYRAGCNMSVEAAVTSYEAIRRI